MTGVILDLPIEAMPDLMTRAAHPLARVNLIEVLPDGALVASRTTFAFASDTTRFALHRKPDGRTEVIAVSPTWGGVGIGVTQDVVGEAGREVLKALARLVHDPA